jgi:hypothetical protein
MRGRGVTTTPSRRSRAASGADWLDLIAVDGPFLAAPVVKDVWSTGLPALDRDAVSRLRDASELLDASPGSRDAFLRVVLADFLGWGDHLAFARDLPAGLTTPIPEHATEVRPDFALLPTDGAKPALLGLITAPGTRATARTATSRSASSAWTASPADRLAHALRSQEVPLGLVTDGTEWALVCLPGGAVTTVAWTRHVWFDESETLRAFHALLCRQRFFGVEEERALPALLRLSLERQEEITERLKEQSQAVVDMLVATIGRLDSEQRARERQGLLPDSVKPSDVYAAAVTILMRLVFLLYAEEQGLLPLDDPIYSEAYAASTLAAELRARATEMGEDALERSSQAWHRILAASRAIHRGSRHEDLGLPAYGGSLFDPDRFPWLEGRASAGDPIDGATPLAIDDRTLLHSMEALQTLRFGRERRRISFRQLDVEQIGYVYEGLIGEDAMRSDDWVLGVASDSRGERDGPELALREMELKLDEGPEEFAGWLAPLTDSSAGRRSEASILKAILAEADDSLWRAVLEACGGDEAAARAILPFGRLLRRDPRELPVVYPPLSLYLTESDYRAHTGTVYTPRALAERVVVGALEPLVYAPGPLDTEDRAAWRLRPPDEILALRVIDIAAGSGAFLVAATRYLAARLIESRALHEGLVVEVADRAAAAQELDARRAIVDHCIYGVDINPMAVEMCKLSLWLVTLDRSRPFTFLDDRIAVGDSLLGITSADQLVNLSMTSRAGEVRNDRLPLWPGDVGRLIGEAAQLRRQITGIPMIDVRSAEDKGRLLDQARELTSRLARIADALSAASLRGGSAGSYDLAVQLAEAYSRRASTDTATLEEQVSFVLTDRSRSVRRPAHFPLLFPEVFQGDHPGFDAVIGNPPYLGGGDISGILGGEYRTHLRDAVAYGKRAKRPDLVAFFFLQAARIAHPSAILGLLATNTVAQGDSREIGLDQLHDQGWRIYSAVKSERWPSRSAVVHFAIVCLSAPQRTTSVVSMLDGERVHSISPSLAPTGRTDWRSRRLRANEHVAFEGSVLHGIGFTVSPHDAETMIVDDPRNAEVLRPFLGGQDLLQSPLGIGSRWVIDFQLRSQAEAATYREPWEWVQNRVKPERKELDPQRYQRIIDCWWQYWAPRSELYEHISGLERVLVIAQTSKTLMPHFVSARQVFQQTLIVFTTDDPAMLALLSSSLHYWWAIARASTLKGDLRYSKSDVFETFPLPPMTAPLRFVGDQLERGRRALMLDRELGLTATYNLMHDPRIRDPEVENLRQIHVAVDEAACSSYGWDDLTLGHGHHETRQGARWTVAPAVQREVLDRLLELNHERWAVEQRSGTARRGSRSHRMTSPSSPQGELFVDGTV